MPIFYELLSVLEAEFQNYHVGDSENIPKYGAVSGVGKSLSEMPAQIFVQNIHIISRM